MVSHTSLDSILLELSWALFGITFLVLTLRIIGEIFLVRSFKLSSRIAVLAFLIAVVSQILIALAVHNGLGKHIEGLNPHQIAMVQTYLWQAQPLQLLANAVGKISIAALLVTLHGPRFAKARTIFIWSLIGLQVVFVTTSIALIYSQCSPVQKLWRAELAGTCNGRVRNRNFGYVQGGISSFVDLALAIYPICLFAGLQIEFAKKMMLSLFFAFGFVAAASAIMRTLKLSSINQTQDLTHAVAELVIWNTTEMYLVLLGGSLPGLRPLFNRRMRTPPIRDSNYGYPRPPSGHCDKKSFVMKLSNLPATRSKAYAGNGNHDNDGSTVNFLEDIGPRNIFVTTEVNVISGRNSTQAHGPSDIEHEQHGTEV